MSAKLRTQWLLQISLILFVSIGFTSSCTTLDEQDEFGDTSVGSFEDIQDSSGQDSGEEYADSSFADDEDAVSESESEFDDSSSEVAQSEDQDSSNIDDEFGDDEFADSDSDFESEGEDSFTSNEFEDFEESEDAVVSNEPSSEEEFSEFSEPSFQEPAPEQAESSVADNAQETQIATDETELPLAEATPPAEESQEVALSPEPSEPESAEASLTPETVVADQAEATIAEPETSMNQYSDDMVSASDTGVKVKVTDMQFRINDQGGTLIIQANGPLEFNQRLNPQTNQLVIELNNATLPRKLQRPFNTRDFPGQIGYIDAYQLKGASVPRVVVQLREGATEPVVQNEGNALYVISQGSVPATGSEMTLSAAENGTESLDMSAADTSQEDSVAAADEAVESSLFASENFEDFLRSNQKFSGKRISIETDDMELRDIFKLVSEEAGVNLVLADDIRGKMSLKLKSVPWDQALVMIMKAKKLGYSRSGSILRVAPMVELRTEEEDAIRIATAKRVNQPAIVKSITVNYAKVEELERQIRPLLTAKGAVVGDARTSAIMISDVEENVARAEVLVKSLDIPPQQVLIEGKIVEASDNFERQVGINWSASGRQVNLGGRGANGPIRFTPGLSVTPGSPSASTLGLSFALGTLDVLGDLTASLRLFELQGLVKVISSPRILTLHNETAEIGQTTEIPLITSNIQPNGATTPIVNFKPVQLRLSVTPQVTNDGAIIMGVDMTREVPGEVVNAETNARPVNSRSAKTKVLLKNSQTAVIGGIYQNDTTESESRVPGIAKVPIIGWLFKNKSIDRKRTELLIFLTPRILGQMQGLPTAEGSPDIPNNIPMESTVESALDLGEDQEIESDSFGDEVDATTETSELDEENFSDSSEDAILDEEFEE